MKEQRKTTLRHLAELISQNKHLEEENHRLQQQLEFATSELEKYRSLASRFKYEKKEESTRKPRTYSLSVLSRKTLMNP